MLRKLERILALAIAENAVEESFSGKDKLFDITVDVSFDLVHTPE